METKHTPGNWMAQEGQIYPEETGKTLALIPYFDGEDEQEANAKLIASAPELLKTLNKLKDCVAKSCSIGSDPKLYELLQVWQEAAQAINKATE